MFLSSKQRQRVYNPQKPALGPGLITGPLAEDFFASSSLQRTKTRPLVFLPNGRTLIQNPHPYIPDEVQTSPLTPAFETYEPCDTYTAHTFDDLQPSTFRQDAQTERTPSGQKKTKQWERWRNEVIPQLLRPFMEVLRRSHSLRVPVPPLPDSPCNCGARPSSLEVLCVHFDRLETLELDVCRCHPVSNQLLNLGLFPCSPCFPTLAVDLNLLDFTLELFLHIPPNRTAVSSTIETFLYARGYAFGGKDSLRRRFSNALRWFGVLRDETQALLNCELEMAWREQSDEVASSPSSSPSPSSFDTMPSSPCPGRNIPLSLGHGLHKDVSEQANSGHSAEDAYASRYLQDCCPACFGGKVHDSSSLIDVLVCLDACFQQKRGQGSRDPQVMHPDSVFVPESEVRAMEEHVNAVRGPPSSVSAPSQPFEDSRKRRSEEDGVNDAIAPGMQIPESVLDGCSASFKAADDKRKKASTTFFSDTGLMALLCRHDQVLWLANMTSAGEKQYYPLALVAKLLQHLPKNIRVGVLYDIGCQLHRSIVKWNFLPDDSNRLVFALSVLHAFGHQWTCQLVYHPRKRPGFGLTDGEGCERFWSSIKHLIPTMRVSGFHSRIYTIDSQVHHLRDANLHKLGSWIGKRYWRTKQRLFDAVGALQRCGFTEKELVEQWRLQIAEQTKPLPRQSKTAAHNAVEEVAALQSRLEAIKLFISTLDNSAIDPTANINFEESEAQARRALSTQARLEAEISRRRRKLGISETQQLRALEYSSFISDRMNARALKTRLRSKLTARKFEIQNIERPYKSHTSGSNERKKIDHIESQLHHRDPGITQLTQKYNKLCQHMRALQSKGQAPEGAVCPDDIPTKGLFSLDVDSTIWSDLGLYDDDDDDIPLWLGDENVRDGVRAMLAVRRCEEELARLAKEHRAMKEWFSRRWASTTAALVATPTASGLHYMCTVRSRYLLRLFCLWEGSFDSLPIELFPSIPSWGPRRTEVHEFLLLQQRMSGKVNAGSSDDLHSFTHFLHFDTDGLEADNDGNELETQDGEVLEVMEAMEALDELNSVTDGSESAFDGRNVVWHELSVLSSPRKRARITNE